MPNSQVHRLLLPARRSNGNDTVREDCSIQLCRCRFQRAHLDSQGIISYTATLGGNLVSMVKDAQRRHRHPPFATAVLDKFSELTYIISGGALTDNEVTLLSTLHPLVFSGVSDKSKRGKPHICTVAQTNPAWIQMPWLSYRTSAAPACPLHSVFLASR